MTHPNNQGKGTYTEKRKAFARSPERLAYMREYNRKYARKYYETAKKYRTDNWEKIKANMRKSAAKPERKYYQYQKGAERRNMEFALSFEDYVNLQALPCVYCGGKTKNGIDRVDNSVGYCKENCVTCCAVCNKMKLTHSKQFFIEQCKKIAQYNI
jgi:hypothetical protein